MLPDNSDTADHPAGKSQATAAVCSTPSTAWDRLTFKPANFGVRSQQKLVGRTLIRAQTQPAVAAQQVACNGEQHRHQQQLEAGLQQRRVFEIKLETRSTWLRQRTSTRLGMLWLGSCACTLLASCHAAPWAKLLPCHDSSIATLSHDVVHIF